MRRIDKVRALQREVLEEHEEMFGWTDASKDHGTGYHFLDEPAKYDYEAWATKAEALNLAVAFLENVDDTLDELAEIGAEDAIKIVTGHDNVCIKLKGGFLTLGYGYYYLSKMVCIVRPPVEVDGPLSESEYLAKARDAVQEYEPRALLRFFHDAFEKEYQRARQHLDWLETDVGDDEESVGDDAEE